jgi:hypothetical protein
VESREGLLCVSLEIFSNEIELLLNKILENRRSED